MKQIILSILIIIFLTACQQTEKITSKKVIDANDLVLMNSENDEQSPDVANIQENKIAVFYDYGTIQCKCADAPENYSGLAEKYKGKIYFQFVSYFDAPDKYRAKMPLQQILDSERNEIVTHEGHITKEEIISMIDSYLDE